MSSNTPIPHGMHTVTPHLVYAGGGEAIEFYKTAFGAVELMRLQAPDGKLVHGCIRIGDLWLLCEAERTAQWRPGEHTQDLWLRFQTRAFCGDLGGSMMTRLWTHEGSLERERNRLTLDTEGPVCGGDGKLARERDILEFRARTTACWPCSSSWRTGRDRS